MREMEDTIITAVFILRRDGRNPFGQSLLLKGARATNTG